MTSVQEPSLQPLLRSVLAVLKVAQELGHEMNRTKLVKLLYFADLAAVEGGGTAFTGATWRWDNYGPYDTAIRRAEDAGVASQLVDRDDRTRSYEYGACYLKLALDIGDPLPGELMELVRRVVRELGAKTAGALRDMSYKTPPMVEATAAGDHRVLLDLSRARRARQVKALLARHQRHRTGTPKRVDDPGVAAELLEEMGDLAIFRGRVNAEELDDK
ncbi:MAG TPA: Panacea domain-containing protein [Streptosporangiaceae bacterium]